MSGAARRTSAAGPATSAPARSSRRSAARTQAIACARAADEKQAERTLVLDVTGQTSVTDYMVVTSASSRPHLNAVAEAVEEALKQSGGKLHHREGDHNSPWILLDGYDVIVHIFDEAARRYYDLERLWMEGKRVPYASRPPRSGAGMRKNKGKHAAPRGGRRLKSTRKPVKRGPAIDESTIK